jgi:hypothetical protein
LVSTSKCVLVIQNTLQEIRKVPGDIPILVSDQRLLDGTSRGKEPDGDASRKKPEEGGGGRGCLRIGCIPLGL